MLRNRRWAFTLTFVILGSWVTASPMHDDGRGRGAKVRNVLGQRIKLSCFSGPTLVCSLMDTPDDYKAKAEEAECLASTAQSLQTHDSASIYSGASEVGSLTQIPGQSPAPDSCR